MRSKNFGLGFLKEDKKAFDSFTPKVLHVQTESHIQKGCTRPDDARFGADAGLTHRQRELVAGRSSFKIKHRKRASAEVFISRLEHIGLVVSSKDRHITTTYSVREQLLPSIKAEKKPSPVAVAKRARRVRLATDKLLAHPFPGDSRTWSARLEARVRPSPIIMCTPPPPDRKRLQPP